MAFDVGVGGGGAEVRGVGMEDGRSVRIGKGPV